MVVAAEHESRAVLGPIEPEHALRVLVLIAVHVGEQHERADFLPGLHLLQHPLERILPSGLLKAEPGPDCLFYRLPAGEPAEGQEWPLARAILDRDKLRQCRRRGQIRTQDGKRRFVQALFQLVRRHVEFMISDRGVVDAAAIRQLHDLLARNAEPGGHV